MENQEMKSFVDNHQSMKFLNKAIDNVNEAIASEEQIVAKGIRESSDNLADIADVEDEFGVDLRAKVENLSGFFDEIAPNLEPLSETRSLDNLVKLRNYLETLKFQLEAKFAAEWVTEQPGIENSNKLFDSPRAKDIGIPKGELIKIFVVDTDNTLISGLTNALYAFDNGAIIHNRDNEPVISFDDLKKYIYATHEIAQYDNFGIFRRDNKDLIMNPTPAHINKLTENVAALIQKKEENKIIPKGKDESNKIIPQKGKSKDKKQTKFWKWQK